MNSGRRHYSIIIFGWYLSINIFACNKKKTDRLNKRVKKFIQDTNYEYRQKDK